MSALDAHRKREPNCAARFLVPISTFDPALRRDIEVFLVDENSIGLNGHLDDDRIWAGLYKMLFPFVSEGGIPTSCEYSKSATAISAHLRQDQSTYGAYSLPWRIFEQPQAQAV